MSNRFENFRVFGCDPAPGPPCLLRAGPFSLHYDAGDLRYVKLGEREVVRRLYAAVRDQNWGTISGQVSQLRLSSHASGFVIAYRCEHQQGDIHFVWDADIVGESDGTIRFTLNGEAKTTFLKNRIGFCVLHPIFECAGAKCWARYADGTEQELTFPRVIAAEQPIPGFQNLVGLAHEVSPGVRAELKFTGDLFETEDQRNWIDASFKTFCPTLRLPRPTEIRAGTRIRQSVELRCSGTTALAPRITRSASPNVTVSCSRNSVRLPDLGLGSASHQCPLEPSECTRLNSLGLAHLRVDVPLSDPGWQSRLVVAARDASELGLPLELAVHWSPDADPTALFELRRELTRRRADVVRVVAFHYGQRSTTVEALEAVRMHLGDLEVPVGGGTDADLYQLNSGGAPAGADFICWSMNPQVHAFDNASLAETPEAAGQQVTSVAHYFSGTPMVISPITLKPRFNPVATGPEIRVLSRPLPPAVDPRQLSLFGAAWTVAMLAALAPSGVESLTFFETTGWRGVMERAAGSPLPQEFPSEPGQVFPLWHVFAALRGYRDIAATVASEPLRVASLAVSDRSGSLRVLLANLSPDPVSVRLTTIANASLRVLDARNIVGATQKPEEFWRRTPAPLASAVELGPHALAFIDSAAPARQLE